MVPLINKENLPVQEVQHMYRILIIEDDSTIAQVLEQHLTQWGYTVGRVTDFSRVLEEVEAFAPQLVLLDISLPFFNGFHWCSELRKRSQVPIIFLSSAADHMNAVMAMQMGGDDFIAKPFDLAVLTAKVQALLRRSYDFSAGAELLSCGGAVLNLDDATLLWEQQRIQLTRNEFRILKLLMERRGRIVAREDIMTALWESDSFVDENTLTVNINRLRKKLAAAGLEDFIQTRKGAGYLVECAP